MSFGTSPSDVDTVVAFCRALYRKCRDAGGEYDEISQEVRGLHTVLKHLKYEVEASDSPVNRDRATWSRQLSPIVEGCDDTLRELDDLVREYNRLNHASSSPTSSRRRGGNLDTLGLIRVKLLSHKSKLTKLLDNIQLEENVPEELDNQDGHLDTILDKVDSIAARIGSQNRKGASVTHNGDDREVWKQFRRELIAEGFSLEVLDHHRDVLRAYIREIDQKGLLEECPPNSQPTPVAGITSKRWLEPVKAIQPGERPPTFSSLDLPTDDGRAKAVLFEEANMKFPQSLKMELRQPEIRRGGGGREESNQIVPSSSRQRRTSGNSHRLPSQTIPRLITSDGKDDKDFHYLSTESSSDDESDRESRRRSEALQLVKVINTTELIAYSQALQLHPHSPSSFRSNQGYFDDDTTSRQLPFQPKKQLEFGTSPIQPGAIPIPQTNPRTSNSSFGTSPRTSSTRLEPDEHGNEIPPDAKWTKINRRLVSPEVLDQDHRRYEARPEFVAVLGVLSRAEIQGLAERSRIIRDARFRRSLPVQAPPQPPPPRPMNVPVAIPIPNVSSRHRSRRDTPSSSDSESEDSGRNARGKSKGRKGYAGSNIGAPVSGYPNPFGQPLPSPVRSPGARDGSGAWMSGSGSYNEKDKSRERERERDRERDNSSKGHVRDWDREREKDNSSKDYTKDRDREGHRERDRDGSRRRHSSNGSRARGSDRRDRERDAREKYQKSNRWKENLTAAGIGGAAVSLLNVLTEAAEGL
ncbi:hypothetical protein BDZ45DRAFT_719969 [Acephala macrosclerotiorum]|nr:hypothetical protein BDZ45DRAFT_719969 [Acephala macrosclerotiorum]